MRWTALQRVVVVAGLAGFAGFAGCAGQSGLSASTTTPGQVTPSSRGSTVASASTTSTADTSSARSTVATTGGSGTVVMSSPPAGSPATAAAASTDPSTAGVATSPAAQGTSSLDWLTFDGNVDRRGLVVAGPDPHTVAVRWRSPPLDGDVYGQPLVIGTTIVAATEADTVYGLSATDGHRRWSTNLGTPVSKASLPCGNIDPVGITGTPVADPTGATVFVVVFVAPGRHDLVALDTSTGAVRWRQPIDPPNLSPLVEQQRSALTYANGRVYVAFGGLFGDCGPYKGAVVAIDADGGGHPISWVVPTTREGGLWAPSGAAVDNDGNLFLAVGNAASTSPSLFDYGNATVRLTPDLQLADWWAPTDWAELSAADKDLGSQGPVLIGAGRVFVAGKSGVGYILRAGDLGHIGGEISQLQICSHAFGGSASNGTGTVIVVACTDGVTAVGVDSNGALSRLWHAPGGRGGAPIIAGDAAWITSNDGHTRAFDLTNGQTLADLALAGELPGFPGTTVTPATVYVAGDNQVRAISSA